MTTLKLAPAGSRVEDRLAALERAVGQLGGLLNSGLVVPPYARGGVQGSMVAGGQGMLDAQGLIAVMKLLGSTSYSGNQTFSTAAEVTVTGSPIAFTLQRPATVMAFATVSAFMNQNPPIASGNVRIASDAPGAPRSARLRFPFINAGLVSIVESTTLVVAPLPKGPNTWSLVGYVDTAPDTLTVNDWHLDVFLLGA